MLRRASRQSLWCGREKKPWWSVSKMHCDKLHGFAPAVEEGGGTAPAMTIDGKNWQRRP